MREWYEHVSSPLEYCIYLGIGVADCEQITKEHKKIREQVIAISHKWYNNDDIHTWSEFASAFKRMGLKRIADEIIEYQDSKANQCSI